MLAQIKFNELYTKLGIARDKDKTERQKAVLSNVVKIRELNIKEKEGEQNVSSSAS